MKERIITEYSRYNSKNKDIDENDESINKSYICEILNDMFNKFRMKGDEYTISHVCSVAAISKQIAIHLGKTKKEIYEIEIAALLHDYGKIYISSDIINKPGKLTSEEYSIMKSHALIGAIELSKLNKNKILDSAIKVCLQHHERPDGTGYPFSLKENQIDSISKIVSLADATSAMLSRNYSSPKTQKELLQEILKCSNVDKNGKQQFDKKLGLALISLLNNKEKCQEMGIIWKNKDDIVKCKFPTLNELGIIDKKDEKRESYLKKLKSYVTDFENIRYCKINDNMKRNMVQNFYR